MTQTKLSNFLSGNPGPWTDLTNQTQVAITDFLSSNYNSLDLEGRMVSVSTPLLWDQDAVPNGFANPKTMFNGTFNATQDWDKTNEDPILKIFSSSGKRIEKPVMDRLMFKCNSRASGIRFYGQYYQPSIHMCQIFAPGFSGIRTSGDSGVGLHIWFCQGYGGNANIPFENRQNYFLFQEDETDTKVYGGQANYFKTAIRLIGGSFSLNGTHMAQGFEGSSGPFMHLPVIHAKSRSTINITGAYIDNGHILLEEGLGGSETHANQGMLLCNNTRFTKQNSHENGYFIAYMPSTKKANLQNISICHNEFRNFGDHVMKKPFQVLTSNGGNVAVAGDTKRVVVEDNIFWGGIEEQTSHPIIRIPIQSGITKYNVDLTGKTAFDLAPCNYMDAAPGVVNGKWNTDNATAVFRRIDNYTGEVILDKPVNGGSIALKFNCNNS